MALSRPVSSAHRNRWQHWSNFFSTHIRKLEHTKPVQCACRLEIVCLHSEALLSLNSPQLIRIKTRFSLLSCSNDFELFGKQCANIVSFSIKNRSAFSRTPFVNRLPLPTQLDDVPGRLPLRFRATCTIGIRKKAEFEIGEPHR